MYDLETIFNKKPLFRVNSPKLHRFEIYYQICYGFSKTENSGGANALNFDKVGARLQKTLIFGTTLLTLSKNYRS